MTHFQMHRLYTVELDEKGQDDYECWVKMQKKEVITYCKVLFQHLLIETNVQQVLPATIWTGYILHSKQKL
jgi:hypothetical protein